MNRCLFGDCRESLRTLEAGSVQTCVTSPPYWGLRDYGVDGQLGLERTPEEYVANMVEVFREVWRVLRDDGTLWINLGDSYGTGTTAKRKAGSRGIGAAQQIAQDAVPRCGGMAKQLMGIPWRVAFALQADGWYLRQEIIWNKPNPMPESVTDRCTKAHEHVFLLAKSERYYFDSDAISEPLAESSVARLSQPTLSDQVGSARVPGKTNGNMKAVARSGNKARKPASARGCPENSGSNVCGSVPWEGSHRNKRSVWTVATQPYTGAHFATFPPALIEPCILAGSRPGDLVLDPFLGSGTTAQVAQALGRLWVGCELNPAYEPLQRERTAQQGLVLA